MITSRLFQWLRICQVLNCQIGDIVKIIPVEEA
ncbi:helix-turn-helix domain-containing protein [Corynebacterium mastitidis]